MQTRRLGRTGHNSTLAIFGAAAFWEIDQSTANRALDMAIATGVNHIDVAPQYGQGEVRVGAWLPPHRDSLFLGCKTLERTRDAAWAELNQSLEKLNTDHFDLYQFHAIGSFDELDKATAKGGALETLMRARDEGLTRYLGITGHGLDTPAAHLEALNRCNLDTVMFPINPVLYANAAYRDHAERLLDVCMARDIGVMVIKSVAKGPWGEGPKAYNTWYEPYDEQATITQGVHFVLSQPGVTAIASPGDTRLLPMVLDAAATFEPMSREAQDTLIGQSQALEPLFT
jgi:predicted aldo/keto reductase-like oxidoreductase